jgi:hypothetical protein
VIHPVPRVVGGAVAPAGAALASTPQVSPRPHFRGAAPGGHTGTGDSTSRVPCLHVPRGLHLTGPP